MLSISHYRNTIREPMAEFVGVALLVIFGAGSACQVVLSMDPGVAASERGTFLSINFGWAIGIAAGAWISGGISGGHINPALTIAMATYRGFSWRKVPGYIFAQIMGGIVGAALVYANFIHAIDIFEGGRGIRTQATASLFATFALPYMTQVSCFFEEFLSTAILCMVFLALNDKCTSFNDKRNGMLLNEKHNGAHLNGKSKGGPLNDEGHGAHLNDMRDGASLSDEGHGAHLNRNYSGTTLNDNYNDAPANEIGPFALFILFIGLGASLGMQTGWAVNPARDFGPRVFLAMAGYGKAMFNYRSQYWIWAPIIAPILGALTGGLLYDIFLYAGYSSPIKWRRAPQQDNQRGEVV